LTDAKKKVFDECKKSLDNITKLVSDNFSAAKRSSSKFINNIKIEQALIEGLK